MTLALVVIAFAAGFWWRARHLRAMEAITREKRRLGPNGVVVGGEGFELRRDGAPAVLLLHGGGDTPQSLRYVAEGLYARGFHVSVPLLPGHGRSIREFKQVSADGLTRAAREHYDRLRASHDWVGIIGLSMGGALAVQLAANNAELPALGLLAPYLAMPPLIERAARLSLLWGPLVPVVRAGDTISVYDPDEREKNLAYGVFTATALRALYFTVQRAVAQLPSVSAPTLMIQSREDNRITVDAAERAFARLGAREKRLEWMTGAAHVITVDYGRAALIAQLAAFMESHAPPRVRETPTVTSDS